MMKKRMITTLTLVLLITALIIPTQIFAKDDTSNLKNLVSTAMNDKSDLGTINTKLITMGATQEDLNNMNMFQKKVLAQFYDKHNGNAVLLKDENGEFGTRGLGDLSIYGGASYSGSDGTYKYAYVVWSASCDVKPIDMGIGSAFSDGWNIIDHEALTMYLDFWGTEEVEYMYCISSQPQAGVAYGYDEYPWWIDHCNSVFSMDLRTSAANSGTTDVVGACSYSETDVTLGANIGISPSITFTPSGSVYQRADTDYFDY